MKNSIFTLFLSVFIFASCSQTSKESSNALKDQKLQIAYDKYLNLKDALVATDSIKAKKAAYELQNSLSGVWGTETVYADAKQISETDNIKLQREVFSSLSNSFIDVLKKADKAGSKIYIQHCPMALKGKGADWISKEEEIKNPYFGDQMMECGEVKEEIK
jgi:hypothetical protein